MALTLNGTTGLSGIAGSAGTPALQGNNDANTGYFFAADTLGLSTAGTSRLYIISDGKVGIGTTSPTQKLDVAGSLQLGNGNAIGFGDQSARIIGESGASGILRFDVNGGEKVRLDSNGRLLIGADTNASGSSHKLQVFDAGASGSLALSRFTASAYSSYIDFYKSRNATLGSKTVVNSGDYLGSVRFFGVDGSNSAYYQAAEISSQCDGASGEANDMPGRLTFWTRDDGNSSNLTERLRIASDGKVYIGNQSNAASSAYFNKEIDGDYKFNIHSSTSTVANRAITFNIRANVEAMRIDSSGRIKIGTTSTAATNEAVTIKGDSNGDCFISLRSSAHADGNDQKINFMVGDATWQSGNVTSQLSSEITGTSSGVLKANLVISANRGDALTNRYIIYGDNSVDHEFKTKTAASLLKLHNSGLVEIADGDLKVASGHGIDFSATGDASGTGATDSSELFSDYETGTWTPTSRDGTLSYTRANYTKIGRMVHLSAYVNNFSDNSTNDSLTIQGIPFPQTVGDMAVGSVMYSQVSDSNKTTVYLADSRSGFMFYGGGTGGYDQVRYNELNGSSSFYFQATYFA